MKHSKNSLYYSRTETDQSVVIVWKPFSTYSTLVLVALLLVGTLCSAYFLSLIAVLLLVANAVVYSAECKEPRTEINEASRNSSVQVSGSKYSISSPLTITLSKDLQTTELPQEICDTQKSSNTLKKVVSGIFAAIFLMLGLFASSALSMGVRQGAYTGSLIILFVLTIIFFLLAYLCFRSIKK